MTPASESALVIDREDPRAPENAALVAALDAVLITLYTPNTCHLPDVETLASAGAEFVVARECGTPLACGALVPLDEGVGEIKRMWTAPEARGRGLARAILNDLQTRACGRGLSALRLEVGARQPEALALYSSAGFVERGPYRERAPYGGCGDEDTAIYMEKRLDGAEAGP